MMHRSPLVRLSILLLGVAALASWSHGPARASDVGVVGRSATLKSSLTSGRQTVKSLQKDADVHLGASALPAQLSGKLEIYFVDTPANKATLPLPAPWASSSPAVAKYKNILAPSGPTVVKTAVVKNGVLAKVTAKGLGGIDLSAEPGPSGVMTVLTIENAADSSTHRMCTLYSNASGSQITHKATANGHSLKLKNGVAAPCPDCTDGLLNGDETDVDCGGGSCPTCANGESCVAAGDCQSGVCTGNVCQTPTCSDGVENGTETDVDCGGSCGPCADGEGCSIAADCTSSVCSGGICQAPTCSDGAANGDETDVDCGGPTCPDCANGEGCDIGADCQSEVCESGICQPQSCVDGVQNGDESDVDCGGVTCAGCDAGESCDDAGDCQSVVCTGNVCQAPTCSDGVENAAETDVDCGGGTCPACGNGDGCVAPADCQSSVCTGNVCQAPTCSDGVENGTETGTDCGGPSCADCPAGQGCNGPADCQSGVCTGNVCQAPSCSDGVLNGSETGTDCGGGSCPGCGTGGPCLAGGDCLSGVCTGNVCQAPTCTDGIKNGTETDVDCGGASCPDCALNKMCLAGSDCLTNFCTGGRCKCPSQLFTFQVTSNNGGVFDAAEWPGGTASQNGPTGCSVTINRPNTNVDLVCTLGAPFSVNSFAGYSTCSGTGGEDGDGCQPVSCPPAGIGSCCNTRPSCSAALNGSATARYFVQCQP